MNALPTQERLHELLQYDPDTGVFTWRERPLEAFTSERIWKAWNTRHAGNVAGGEGRWCRGYVGLRIDNVSYLAHRLAYKYVHGADPQDGIDHINGDGGDNRITNLRPASQSVNNKNITLRKDNRSGVMGVHWHRAGNKWQASINSHGVTQYLGLFNDLDEAVAVRKAAEAEHGYHANHGRSAPVATQVSTQ